MKQIPNEIKALYNQDCVWKNIRIVFPEADDEYTEICNDKLLCESFKLQQNLCSEQKLKLGVAEAPFLTFTAKSIPNIKDATIDAYIEIDATSCQDVDGVEYKEDLDRYVYPIRLGRFIVTSCKRTADSVNLREVEAMGISAYHNWNVYSEENTFLKDMQIQISLITPDPPAIAKTINAKLEGLLLNEFPSVAKTIKSDSFTRLSKTFTTETPFVSSGYIRAEIDVAKANESSNKMLYINGKSITAKQVRNIRYVATQYCVQKYGITYNTIKSDIEMINRYVYPHPFDAGYNIKRELPTASYYPEEQTMCVPYSIRVYDAKTDDVIWSLDLSTKAKVTFDEFDVDFLGEYNLEYGIIDGESTSRPIYSLTSFPFKKSRELIASYLELYGMAGRCSDDGLIDAVSLKMNNQAIYPKETLFPADTLYPMEDLSVYIYKKSIKALAYQEDESKEYGRVICTFHRTVNGTQKEYFAERYMNGCDSTTKDDYDTYSITDNLLIKNFEWTRTQINGFTATIKSSIASLRYQTMQLSCVAYPWLEIGDLLKVEGDGTFIKTYNLISNINGIQLLTNSVEAI